MAKKILTKFGESLRDARVSKGLSQEKLAEAVQLDRTYISLLERGKRNPSLLCIVALCKNLEISLTELLEPIKLDEENLESNHEHDLDRAP